MKQFMASFINFYDQVEAQRTQQSAINDNLRVFHPISGFNYVRNAAKFNQAIRCLEFFGSIGDLNKLLIDFNSIKEDLVFKEMTSDRFEEAIKNVAKYIGFDAERPENDYRYGPDNLWNAGDLKYFVIEAKNGSTTDKISKHDCNQLNGSCIWFETNYRDCLYTPIMIHCSNVFEYACSPNPKIRVMTPEKLKDFSLAVESFIKAIVGSRNSLTSEFISNQLMYHRLREMDIVNAYTVSFRK